MNTDFCSAKSQGAGGVSREDALKNLASAFDSFMELKGNLEEGTKVSRGLNKSSTAQNHYKYIDFVS